MTKPLFTRHVQINFADVDVTPMTISVPSCEHDYDILQEMAMDAIVEDGRAGIAPDFEIIELS